MINWIALTRDMCSLRTRNGLRRCRPATPPVGSLTPGTPRRYRRCPRFGFVQNVPYTAGEPVAAPEGKSKRKSSGAPSVCSASASGRYHFSLCLGGAKCICWLLICAVGLLSWSWNYSCGAYSSDGRSKETSEKRDASAEHKVPCWSLPKCHSCSVAVLGPCWLIVISQFLSSYYLLQRGESPPVQMGKVGSHDS